MPAQGLGTVLVVDDDDLLRVALAEAFELEGYTVEVATNGAEALAKLVSRRVDAIVLDLMLPVLDGWGFIEASHQLPEYGQAPIVAISAAYGLSAAAASLRDKGVRAVLAKPFDLHVLLGAVEGLVQRQPENADL